MTWEITSDNRPIPDGLGPEQGATLNVYTYDDYISPEAVASFEDKYGVRVKISTFNSTDDALTKIEGGGVDFDIYTPSYDQIGRLVTGGLLRPLNHSYIQNITNVWPAFINPWYDGQWRYSVPYTVYTTGIAWRTDQVPADIGALANPYAALWDPAYKNQTAVVDDGHTVISMVLLKLGLPDVNTSSSDDLEKVRDALAEMRKNTEPAVTATMYTDLPAGLISLTQMWSDDIIAAKDLLPEGVSPEILRYWFPADGKGLVDNDLLVTPRSGKNPVAAQLFLNHMLDTNVAKSNLTSVGCQSPQISFNPDSLVANGFIPANLKSAIVRPEYFDVGYRILELDPANDDAWESIWRAFKTHRS
ncbi:MAG: polyamine ABC transporter substrate-binding protein [Mycobacterium sp.]